MRKSSEIRTLVVFIFLIILLAVGVSADLLGDFRTSEYLSDPNVFELDGTLNLISADFDGNCYGYTWDGTYWISNSSLVSGLADAGDLSFARVFEINGTKNLIIGTVGNTEHGYTWNGNSWISNSSVMDGFGLISSPAVFEIDNQTYAIYHYTSGEFLGKVWNGSSWISNSSLVSGIENVTNMTNMLFFNIPEVFNLSGEEYLIIHGYGTNLFGFHWNGTSWEQNSSIVSGISGIDAISKISKFNYLGDEYLLIGSWNGDFRAFKWTGSSWAYEQPMAYGLGSVLFYSKPALFLLNGKMNMVSGRSDARFFGYTYDGSSWNDNISIISGLGDIGSFSSPNIFNISGTNYMIASSFNGTLYSYTWNGSSWITNSSIIVGLENYSSLFQFTSPIGFFLNLNIFEFNGTKRLIALNETYDWNGTSWLKTNSFSNGLPMSGMSFVPTAFMFDGSLYVVFGNTDGTFTGYIWTGSSWVLDSDVSSGLTDIGDMASPSTLEYSGKMYLVSGSFYGTFYVFDRDIFANFTQIPTQTFGTSSGESSLQGNNNTNLPQSFCDACLYNPTCYANYYAETCTTPCVPTIANNNCTFEIPFFIPNDCTINYQDYCQCKQDFYVNYVTDDCYYIVQNETDIERVCFDIFGNLCYYNYSFSNQSWTPNPDINISSYIPPEVERGLWNFVSSFWIDFLKFNKFYSFNQLLTKLYQNNFFIFQPEKNSTFGSCEVRTDRNIWFSPNVTKRGTDNCEIGYSWRGRTGTGNLSFQTYNESDVNRLISTNIIGGGGSSKTIYKTTYIQNVSINDVSRVTENIIDKKIKIVKETKALEVQTENRNSRFDIFAIAGQILTKRIYIRNIGKDNLVLKTYCQGDLCEYTVLDKSMITLKSGEENYLAMQVSIPSDAIEGKELLSNIIVQDTTDETFVASLPVKITINGFLGRLTNILSIDKIFRQGLRITEKFYIPNFVLMIFTIITTFGLLSFAYISSGRLAFFNLLRYIGTILSIIIFLVLI